MSSLTDIDKRYLEKLFGMEGGYVLDYSDATFGEFFHRYKVNIHGRKYQTYGTSKAKKMRAFWTQESDALVVDVLSEMLKTYETACDLSNREPDTVALEKSHSIVARLSDGSIPQKSTKTIKAFSHRDFTIPSIQKLPIASQLKPIIKARLEEALRVWAVDAYLSAIILFGSVLEALLLGVAQKEPAKFNQASCSPKSRDGYVKKFDEWSLAEFIDVACEVGVLKLDIKAPGHGLRYLRNYVHPHKQMNSGFTADAYTVGIYSQVLKAVLASVAGERK